jgi:hypothetical protein
MSRVIEDALVEPVSRVLLGAIDVDGGATAEQRGGSPGLREVPLAEVRDRFGVPPLR